MPPTLSDRLRQALRDFKQAAAARARLETETESGYRERLQGLDRDGQDQLGRLEQAYQNAMAEAVQEIGDARTRIAAQFDGDMARATDESDKAKRAAMHRYGARKEKAVAEFKEARWTITTVYDSGRKVARDQYAAAQAKSKSVVERLNSQQHEALQLLQKWQFANDLPLVKSLSSEARGGDPWHGLQACAAQGGQYLARLQALTLPGYLRGVLPFLAIALIWVVVSLPAVIINEWYYWLAATTAVIVPFGLLIRMWLKLRARTQAVFLWTGLCQAAVDAKHLRPRGPELAKQTYREQRSQNKRRNQQALNEAATQSKKTMQELRKERSQKLRHAQATFAPLTKRLTKRRDRELQAAETAFQEKQTKLKARREQETRDINERYKKLRDETNRRHADDWTRMVSLWKQGCDRFQDECRAVEAETREWFPPWDDEAWTSWRLPESVPAGLPLGSFDVRLEDIPHGVPQDKTLQRPDLSAIDFPILLPFPERAALLLKAYDDGKAAGIRSLQALLMRCWTGLPAGKARCTIIDPVGRGENFAAFMHLADHEESLVNSRIWTEPGHIDQRLSDLTAHMENVLQKYLRNQYETLAEYNEQAGEVAEPYRFLVVADFPVNFTPDAARRLVSLASAGARCGIYTLILLDMKQPMPQGIDRADLERVCTNLNWKQDHFESYDPDFGSFPMELEAPPDPDMCTDLLRIAGEEAKNAARVEVPFDLIAVPQPEWWQGDSRSGLSVPMGRAGATARQFLTLGHGTSQHVLIAGKTGSGKSTLLHVLIAQLAMRYSPSEVELYLIDFKKGVEFKTYAANALPHARVVAVESEREFGLSVLQRLDAELVRRGELFRTVGVNDLPSYRNLNGSGTRQNSDLSSGTRQSSDGGSLATSATGLAGLASGNGKPNHASLPRLVLVVDEFQEFFVEDDKSAQEAALLLDRLVRQGRAFGIHILLGSQTLGGAYSLARSTIDQMAVRIALQCSETDAHLILSKDNSEARLLSRPGEAIYNASGGALEGNHFFQIVWLSDRERDDCLDKVHALGKEKGWRTNQVVFEGNAPADVARNPLLTRLLEQPAPRAPAVLAASAPVQAWLGEAVAIKDPTSAVFRRQSGANLVMIGQQDELAFGMIAASLAALAAQLPPAEEGAAHLNLVIANQLEEEAEALANVLPETLPIRLVNPRDLPAALNRLADEVNRRLKGEGDGPPQFLFVHGLQRLRDLRRPDDDFGYSRKGETAVSPFKQFMTIVREGPALGIYTVLWCDSLTNLQRTLDRQALREFEMRVLFQMSPTDSSTLMDTPVAAKLGMHRALFYTEDSGKLEKFRPYGLPSLEWLRKYSRKMQVVTT